VDKIAHLAVSAVMVMVLHTAIPLPLALIISLLVGLGKEWMDEKPDWNDVKYNVIGLVIAWICLR
jgi:hypothetical protein